MELVRTFSGLCKDDTAIAGGKGASLGEMTQAGISVPDGFVILSTAFERFVEENDILPEIDAALDSVDHKEIHTVEDASEKIKAVILNSEIPDDIKQAIKKQFKKLGAVFVAVRSSATSEDSATAAWAGQLETYLNTTEDTLLENVKKCWASLFSPRAIFYRFEKELHREKISVAVVVQKMVASEQSGISFSVHPVTQDRNQIIIEAGFGLGEAVVSGQITPDSYVVDKQDWHIIDIAVNEQKKGLFRAEGGGNEWQELGEKGKRQVLTQQQIVELSKMVVKIENHYGFPVDVEWAREKGMFYILQSRPITTLTVNAGVSEISTDYIRLFGSTGMPFIITDIALEHYKPLKVIAIQKDNQWTTFIPKEVMSKTLKEGWELFSSKALFDEYVGEFEAYKQNSIRFFEKIASKTRVSRTEVRQFFELISELWKYYKKTEFFYVDDAFRNSKKDKITEENLKQLEGIKNSGREHLNKMIFGKESYLSKVLVTLGKQFSVDVNDLLFYSQEQVFDLFDDKKADKGHIDNKKKSFAFIMRGDSLVILDGNEAEGYITDFLVEHKLGEEIIGTVANPGKVKGRAKVMKYGADTFHTVSQLIKEMRKGDVLIAETTSPEIIAACHKAAAIVTNQGGLMSHAAIVSRELGIPCVVGTGNATSAIMDGDYIEVDADRGIVKIVKN